MSPSEIDSQSGAAWDDAMRAEAAQASQHAFASLEGQSTSPQIAQKVALKSFSKPIHNENAVPVAQSPETGQGPNELHLRIEIGRTLLSVEHMMNLSAGCVIRLDIGSDEPVSVYAGENLIARGQLVLVNECFGVKITELIAAA